MILIYQTKLNFKHGKKVKWLVIQIIIDFINNKHKISRRRQMFYFHTLSKKVEIFENHWYVLF